MPGRIVIMTTNHLDKLDPALIRPGRINKILLLGYVQPTQGEDMLGHWFADQPLDEGQRARLHAALGPGTKVTPAFLEGLCAEHEEVEELLQVLERRAGTYKGGAGGGREEVAPAGAGEGRSVQAMGVGGGKGGEGVTDGPLTPSSDSSEQGSGRRHRWRKLWRGVM